MTRRSCVIPAVGIISALLLAAGIGLLLSAVFRTLMHNRLKKVKKQNNNKQKHNSLSSSDLYKELDWVEFEGLNFNNFVL